MSHDPDKCTICGKPALYKVNNLGYCKAHQKQAIAEKKAWPREHKSILDIFKRR